MYNKEAQHRYYLKSKEKKKLYRQEYTKKNKEKVAQTKKLWAEANKEKTKEDQKKWREANRNKLKDYYKKRFNSDQLYKLKVNVKNLIGNAFRNNQFDKLSKTEQILGCTYAQLQVHLEAQFQPWMSWGNRGLYNGQPNYGWDIDHIVPLATANDSFDLLRLNHYTNLQPLCSHINRDIKR